MTTETARQWLTRAADKLDALTTAATPGPWVTTGKSARYGGLVCVDSPNADADERDGYGGELVGETLTAPNRALIATQRDIAPHVAAMLRADAADWDEDEPADAIPLGDPAGLIARALLDDDDDSEATR